MKRSFISILNQRSVFTATVSGTSIRQMADSLSGLFLLALLSGGLLYSERSLRYINHNLLQPVVGISLLLLLVTVGEFYYLISKSSSQKKPDQQAENHEEMLHLPVTSYTQTMVKNKIQKRTFNSINHTDLLQKEVIWEDGSLYQYNKTASSAYNRKLYSKTFSLHYN